MTRLVLAAMAIVAVSAGCAHATKQVKPAAKPRAPTACERARETALHEPRRNVLHGDVDGSGYGDAVTLVKVPSAPRRCGAFLIVRGHRRTMTWPLHGNANPALPRLDGLARLLAGRLHIVVTSEQRASVSFARLFAIRHWRISPVLGSAGTLAGQRSFVIPYGGSGIHLYGVNCDRVEGIVVSRYFPRANGLPFGFVRHVYWLDDRWTSDRLDPHYTKRGTTRKHREFEEFRRPQPFPTCFEARAKEGALR
jgi:hypothetical protein